MSHILPSGSSVHARPAWVPRTVPFALFIGALVVRAALDDDAGALGFDAAWLYALQLVPAAIALAWFWPRLEELRKRPEAARLLSALAAGAVVFALWISLTAPWMRIGEPVASFVPVAADGTLQWPLIVLRALGAALLVPLIEELFWRSFVMRWIDRRDFRSLPPRAVSWFAVLASSAVFALEHDLWLAGLVAGLIYALTYARTGNLWNAVIAHATTNLLLAAWVVHGRQWAFW